MIASARDLVLALQTIAVRCEFQQAGRVGKHDLSDERDRIAMLEKRFARHWEQYGRVAESFGVAYAKARDERKAVEWYTKALRANDGGASIKAAEQRINLEVRLAWNEVSAAYAELEAARNGGSRKRSKTDKKTSAAEERLTKVIADARPRIEASIGSLQHLVSLETSMERASLLGSAYKRLALIAAIEKKADEEKAAIELMKDAYAQAEKTGRDNNLAGFFYPALNRLSAQFALSGGPTELDPVALQAVREQLDAAVRDSPDFWSVVGQSELRVYEALARGDLAGDVDKIIAAYDDLHLRIQQGWMWQSVYDQAHFVLSKYTNGEAAERQAARRLVQHLSVLSGRG
jgi:hypothetical protein